ncbi:MAG: hypothetical protein EBS01_11575 [Verrucomicrobia bacterium]|nr:hypothetical protein [Verrucomicrobiota bacterium]
MNYWTRDEIETLRRLREGFLSGNAGAADYWSCEADLELYDRTFARRIGWKWDAVLSELTLRGWSPPSARLVDWACGSGVAARRTLEHWPGTFSSVQVTDRSYRARNFAAASLKQLQPGLEVEAAAAESVNCDGALVLVSHLLTELSAHALAELLQSLRGAAAVIWVESATRENARRLMEAARDPSVRTGDWRAVAPCTHSGICPLREVSLEHHWCHHFARVPSEVHQDQAWRDFSERVGVDLRVLPYTFVVLERRFCGEQKAEPQVALSRVVGTPREFKGFMKVLSCSREGVSDRILQKRDDPETFKALRKGGELPLYKFHLQGERIVRAEQPGNKA